MHLDDSIGQSVIALFLYKLEAAFAVEAYGQHANTSGLLVTSGSGATNEIIGVMAEWINSTLTDRRTHGRTLTYRQGAVRIHVYQSGQCRGLIYLKPL